MPTTNPRIFLTLAERDLVKLDALAAAWGINRPAALRKALREMVKVKLPGVF